MQTPLRRHIIDSRPDFATNKVAKPVTMPRLPWEPELTFSDDRLETAPNGRISMCRRTGELGARISAGLAYRAIKAAHRRHVEEMA